MSVNNFITLAVGILLVVTSLMTKKRSGVYDWLYLILGIVIICIGLLQIFKIINVL